MSTSRYSFTAKLNSNKLATSDVSSRIYFAAINGRLAYNDSKLADKQRLDHIAYKAYGDSSLWWVIAAASGIGWSLQCPPGTVIRVPTDLNQIYDLLR